MSMDPLALNLLAFLLFETGPISLYANEYSSLPSEDSYHQLHISGVLISIDTHLHPYQCYT